MRFWKWICSLFEAVEELYCVNCSFCGRLNPDNHRGCQAPQNKQVPSRDLVTGKVAPGSSYRYKSCATARDRCNTNRYKCGRLRMRKLIGSSFREE